MTHLNGKIFAELETLLDYLAKSDSRCCKMGIFVAILGRLCEVWQIPEEETFPPLDVFKLTACMRQNFQRSLTMKDLCRLAAMSPATLQRHFHAALGTPPMTYLRNLRLEHAADLLLNTEFTLTEIAELSGIRRRCRLQTASTVFSQTIPNHSRPLWAEPSRSVRLSSSQLAIFSTRDSGV